MKKEVYIAPEMEVVVFETEDIITASTPLDENETPIMPNLLF